MDCEKIWNEALGRAAPAAFEENQKLGPEMSRGLDCGFAWVVIKPARGQMVEYLKSIGVGATRNYSGGGYEIWYSDFDKTPTQSVSVHYAAASAVAEVLRENGVSVFAESRLD